MAIFFLFAEIGPIICCHLLDEASFLEIGGGCITPHTPPGVSALGIRDKNLSEKLQLESDLTLEKAVNLVRQRHRVYTYRGLS